MKPLFALPGQRLAKDIGTQQMRTTTPRAYSRAGNTDTRLKMRLPR